MIANSGICDILTGPLSEACSKDNKRKPGKIDASLKPNYTIYLGNISDSFNLQPTGNTPSTIEDGKIHRGALWKKTNKPNSPDFYLKMKPNLNR